MNWQRYILILFLLLPGTDVMGQKNAVKAGVFIYSWGAVGPQITYERQLHNNFSVQLSLASILDFKYESYVGFAFIQPRFYFFLHEKKKLNGFYAYPILGGRYDSARNWFGPNDPLNEGYGVLGLGLGLQYQIWKGLLFDVNFTYPSLVIQVYHNQTTRFFEKYQGTFLSQISLGYAF